jgi:hypothetical protein
MHANKTTNDSLSQRSMKERKSVMMEVVNIKVNISHALSLYCWYLSFLWCFVCHSFHLFDNTTHFHDEGSITIRCLFFIIVVMFVLVMSLSTSLSFEWSVFCITTPADLIDPLKQWETALTPGKVIEVYRFRLQTLQSSQVFVVWLQH